MRRTAKKHMLRISREKLAQKLAQWLNGADEAQQPARKEISELIELFRAGKSKDITPDNWIQHPKMAELRRRLHQYRFSPWLAMPPRITRSGQWEIRMIPPAEMSIGAVVFHAHEADTANLDPKWLPAVTTAAVWDLIQLAEFDLIERLRHCQQCGAWYFASRKKQAWCGQQCRQRHYLSKPKARQKRNEYMAKYMRERYSVKAARKG